MKIIDDGQAVISIAEYDRLRASDENRDKIEVTFLGRPRGLAAWLPSYCPEDKNVQYPGKDETLKVLQAAYDESLSLKDAEIRVIDARENERLRELIKIDESFWYRLRVLFVGPKF